MSGNDNYKKLTDEYSDSFDYSKKETAIILAAGHGKRIKSKVSKMLHKIWEVPTVERVYNACQRGLQNANAILVVGIKADDVIKTVGKKESLIYAYQEVQRGTGHAVQIALEKIDSSKYDGTVFIFPGDMGLIDQATVAFFRNKFLESSSDMMVLTGMYDGDIGNNYYGRIVRAKDRDAEGASSGNDMGNVIEIIEYKDILSLNDTEPYVTNYKGRKYSFTKKELLEIREFNSGVFAFRFKPLSELINKISSDNAQKEIYLTDLIALFNKNGYKVSAVTPERQYVLMGFNNKSVLREMDNIARELAYDKLKDIVMIHDPEDFFVDDEVIDYILKMDKNGEPLDIEIGKGAYLGRGVKPNYNVKFNKNCYLFGSIDLGKNITIHDGAHLSCFENQTISVGDNTQIYWNDVIRGQVKIGSNCAIESGVRITGSDDSPVIIGNNVTVKGTTYIFGSEIDENLLVEHSVLINKKVKNPNADGSLFKVRFYIPETEGAEAIEDKKARP
ncbi:N-acetylglucosamine-1-phosphate uridyltransferase [Melioribacter roseus P3M-2]|uniref:N-acetylglucosamine-1-phosphate uridyltransferase n=1 Tax=Melioribacter roseus (strain DSM 23840 / JCM 17771 / VKM B-2668 / P3M-2) TaxID=1191523 RepID=I6ZXL0_MELRP|nr:NTP transferase domain-containing protein [Melioribacter roseus]AFN73793.1 N-acetylglucosamine-1-phosphate uridyltransferase [Melioribacter roseus P3M-2]